MNMDERTSPQAVLTLDDDTVSKIPRKLPIISLAVFVVVTLGLLATTILFAVQKGNLAFELAKVNATANPQTSFEHVCLTDQCFKSASVFASTMNREQNPCLNFFEYACGGWNKNQVIPEDQLEATKLGELNDDLKVKLKGLIERDPQFNEPASYTQVRNYYQACLDLDTINTLRANPLTDLLDSLGGWPVLGASPGGNWSSDLFDFESLLASLRGQHNIDAIISTAVTVNFTNSNEYMLRITIPDFAVPLEFREKRQKRISSLIPESVSADHGRKLLLTDELSDKRQAYKQYMVDIAMALGSHPTVALEDMTDVMEFETTLAGFAKSAIEENGDVSFTTVGELSVQYYGIDWLRLFEQIMPASVNPPVTRRDAILNIYPSYVSRIHQWLADRDNRVKANYMIWRLVNRMVPYLGENFLAIYQRYVNTITGITAATARWKDCVNQAITVLPLATGRMYVDEYFSVDTKKKTEEMVGNLQTALNEMINNVEWLERSDKSVAKDKLSAMGVYVGFPDWLKDNARLDAKTADLTVQENAYFANGLNYRRRIAQTELGRLRLPTDKSLWAVTGPAAVNAFYSPIDNGIVIPAAILQPPIYHPEQPWYSNYGGIGMVLGHEITHGFDSTGRRFDKDGNFRNWWSLTSSLNFDEKAQCMVDQYSAFVLPENHKNLDGEQTEAENIADNGGLREAYKAYKANPPAQKKRLPGFPNLTDDQMFFLSYSQIWCNVLKPEGADLEIEIGSHSPGRFRVIGPLQNNEDFNKAFNCPAGGYMNPYHKCKVWY